MQKPFGGNQSPRCLDRVNFRIVRITGNVGHTLFTVTFYETCHYASSEFSREYVAIQTRHVVYCAHDVLNPLYRDRLSYSIHRRIQGPVPLTLTLQIKQGIPEGRYRHRRTTPS